MTFNTKRPAAFEPLYDIHPDTGATIEVFHADRVFASLRGPGWFWWTCKPGFMPDSTRHLARLGPGLPRRAGGSRKLPVITFRLSELMLARE